MINPSAHDGTGPLSVLDPNQYAILIVDDNRDSAQTLHRILTHAHYQVHVSTEGEAVLDVIAALHPDLIVLSLNNVALDALEVCRAIKQSEATGYLPVIMITDAQSAGDRLNSIRSGADEHLVTPLDERTFLTRVRALLGIKQRFDNLLTINHQLTDDLEIRNRQLEDALAAARELDLVKTAIVRNVGHELRTPLLQVKSSIALLREDIQDSAPNASLIDMAVQAVGRLESTVTNITQLVESQNLRLEPVALGESVDLAIRNLRRSWQSGDNHKRIRKRYDRENLPLVLADKRGIAQVLQHLLDNALKFSPDGGPVDVIIEPRDDGTVWLGVKDRGIGISANKIAHIFESFYQVDASTTRQFSGVGVGLTLAKLIVDQMDSAIMVKSQPGKGSLFSFTLEQADLSD